VVPPDGRGGDHARSLLLTVLGEYVAPREEPVWTGTLVAALAALGVQEKAARQALARSASDGWLTGERVGRRVRYSLSPPTQELLADGARRIYSFGAGRAEWDGQWLVLLVSVPEEQRHLRHRLRTGLAWAGFGSVGQGVWISPDAGREDEARRGTRRKKRSTKERVRPAGRHQRGPWTGQAHTGRGGPEGRRGGTPSRKSETTAD